MKAYCPILAKEAEKGKEVKKYKEKDAGMCATWGESDAEMLSSDEEDNGFKNGVCFMANSNQVTSSHSSSESEIDDATLFEDVDPKDVLEIASQSLEVLSIKYSKVKKEKR